MPKYKYVDGVKYRVVPQSVLGYALVREDSDNSLPAGGTEGQVLTKASNTDYDVEWTTVESGSECINFIIEIEPGSEPNKFALADETKAGEYFNNLKDGKIPVLCMTNEEESVYNKRYFTNYDVCGFSQQELGEQFTLQYSSVLVSASRVSEMFIQMQLGKLYSTGEYVCIISLTEEQYPEIS